MYGAGDAKLGSIIGKGAEAGKMIKRNFMRAVPAYKHVVNKLGKHADSYGWIPALDGGRLHVRSGHKALNTSLQSAGALVAKQWGLTIEDRLYDAGWNHGWDGDFVFLIMAHDEYQIAVRTPNLDLSTYRNDTDYSEWAEDKKVKSHKEKHFQDWCLANSPELRLIGEQVKLAIKDVENHFDFKCPLDCEFKIGLNWAECH